MIGHQRSLDDVRRAQPGGECGVRAAGDGGDGRAGVGGELHGAGADRPGRAGDQHRLPTTHVAQEVQGGGAAEQHPGGVVVAHLGGRAHHPRRRGRDELETSAQAWCTTALKKAGSSTRSGRPFSINELRHRYVDEHACDLDGATRDAAETDAHLA